MSLLCRQVSVYVCSICVQNNNELLYVCCCSLMVYVISWSTLQAILAHTQTRQVHTGVLFHFVIMLSVFFVYFNLTLSENDFLRKDNRGSIVYVCI